MLRLINFRCVRLAAALLAISTTAGAYSVLTHEEIVDLLWHDNIEPLVQQRYRGLTPEQLKECHAYAYGGAVIQDLGYYPFGSRQFSDLVHYVRSGDFVSGLLAEARDANELCFAIGALAHYASDVSGHPAVNTSVADLFPKLRQKFGPTVTYWQNRGAHLKTEFGFDVAQVAKQRYATEQYHDFIGFKVSKPLLERVFPQVYGMELKTVMAHEDLAIGSYRWAVGGLIPKLTKVAWQTHRDEIVQARPGYAERQFLYRLSRAEYEHEWGRQYERPGFGSRILAFFLRLVPHIGPLKALALKAPTPQTEDLYFKSIDQTVERYRVLLAGVRARKVELPDFDLDTGKAVRRGEYPLADKTYRKLCRSIADGKFERMTPELRDNILAFFSAPPAANEKRDAKVDAALLKLRAWTPAAAPVVSSQGSEAERGRTDH
jgi:hypothetical protein